MDLYQHDSPSQFRFEVKGELSGSCVTELRNAWVTVGASYKDRHMAVEISEVLGTDDAGLALLREMRAAGVALSVSRTPLDADLMRSLGVSVEHRAEPRPAWSWSRLLRGNV